MSGGFTLAIVLAGLALVAGVFWLSARRILAKRSAKRAAEQKQEQDNGYGRAYHNSSRSNADDDENVERLRFWAKVATLALSALATLLVAMNCCTIVSANTVAVQISFGRPSGVLDNGFHLKAPWSSTEEFSTRLQTSSRLASTEGDKQTQDCVDVKASGVQACIDTSIRWKISYDRSNAAASQAQILDLWRNYGTFDLVTSNLIRRETETVFANTYGSYTAQDAFGGSKTEEINGKLKKDLDTALSAYGIHVDGLTLGNAHLGADDQSRLNRLFTSQQDILIAQNEAEAAKKQAEANDNLNGSLTDPVLVQRCLDAVSKMSPPPATFNCWPGGSGTPVIVQQPAKK